MPARGSAGVWARRLVPYVVVVIASLVAVHGTFAVRLWLVAFFAAAGVVATVGAWQATRDGSRSDDV